MLHIFVPAALLVLMVSCATPVSQESQPYGSQLMAENSMMKKRLPLIERENDVLKKENYQQREQIQELEVRVSDLNHDFTSLEAKYNTDITAAGERILRLEDTIKEKDRKSTAKIKELVTSNKNLEKKMTQTVKSLNEKMAAQEKAFSQQREQIVQENAKKESALTSQIEEMKKTLKSRESEIGSLKATASELSAKLKEAEALAQTLKKANDSCEAELASVKAANADLTSRLKALSNEAEAGGNRP